MNTTDIFSVNCYQCSYSPSKTQEEQIKVSRIEYREEKVSRVEVSYVKVPKTEFRSKQVPIIVTDYVKVSKALYLRFKLPTSFMSTFVYLLLN